MALSYPPLYIANVTETVNITCIAAGYVNYRWITESGLLSSKAIGKNSNTLVIPNVTSSDEDKYTCVVTTSAGCASWNTTQLIVTGMITIIS